MPVALLLRAPGLPCGLNMVNRTSRRLTPDGDYLTTYYRPIAAAIVNREHFDDDIKILKFSNTKRNRQSFFFLVFFFEVGHRFIQKKNLPQSHSFPLELCKISIKTQHQRSVSGLTSSLPVDSVINPDAADSAGLLATPDRQYRRGTSLASPSRDLKPSAARASYIAPEGGAGVLRVALRKFPAVRSLTRGGLLLRTRALD